MAFNQRQLWLISYDIADPKRLVRVHRWLKCCGLPVQYSVFAASLNTHELRRLEDQLYARIHPNEDDIRFYPLPAEPKQECLGVQIFPEGIFVLESGIDLTGLGKPSGKRKKPKSRIGA
jgi:CRISPR-associated protein Cas2